MLRNFFRKKKTQEPKPELEEISSTEIKDWLNKKTQNLKEKEKEIFTQITEKINASVQDIDKKIEILETIDIESKKVEERAKTIVRQGLDKYINFVKVFTEELENLEKQNINQFIKQISKTFSNFDKRSFIFYQRANYLVGDELLALKQEINNLSQYFTSLFNKNKKTTQAFEIISSIESKLEQLNEITKTLEDIHLEIKLLDEETTAKQKEKETILNKIEEIKTSKEHIKNIENKEDIESNQRQLENSILKLKSTIDFKKLANTFHSDQRKMEKLRTCREDFKKNFMTNKGEDILSLVNEAKLDNNSISNEIKQINKKLSEISKNKKLLEEDKVSKFLKDIERIKLELKNMTTEKDKQEKRTIKIKENKELILESITPNLTKLGATLSHKSKSQ